MSLETNFPNVIKGVFLVYAISVLALADIATSMCLIPMVILSSHAVWARPKAFCVIGTDREACLSVVASAAEYLDVPEIHVYEAERKNDIKGVGIYDDETGMIYEFEEEDE